MPGEERGDYSEEQIDEDLDRRVKEGAAYVIKEFLEGKIKTLGEGLSSLGRQLGEERAKNEERYQALTELIKSGYEEIAKKLAEHRKESDARAAEIRFRIEEAERSLETTRALQGELSRRVTQLSDPVDSYLRNNAARLGFDSLATAIESLNRRLQDAAFYVQSIKSKDKELSKFFEGKADIDVQFQKFRDELERIKRELFEPEGKVAHDVSDSKIRIEALSRRVADLDVNFEQYRRRIEAVEQERRLGLRR